MILLQMHYRAMFSLPYIVITFLAIFQASSINFLTALPTGFRKNEVADFNSRSPRIKPSPCHKSHEVMSQYDTTRSSIFSNVPYVNLFNNVFLQAVCESDVLREAFDLSQTTAKQKGDFVQRYTKTVLCEIGVDDVTADMVGEFAGRAIAPNFDVLTRSIVAPAYSHMAANFLFVDDFLNMDNAEDLGLLFADSIEEAVIDCMNPDPTSKFLGLSNGFVNFFISLGLFTKTKAPLLGYYVGNEWFNAAVNYKCITRDICERNMFYVPSFEEPKNYAKRTKNKKRKENPIFAHVMKG